ncbi:hypothetical protein [Pyxidicoccus xibeiensis]|uniref:hypothetical protein n=1 Tax=Pyxidicoccus xibeiensis TaxID=2906759 RepID=UPI0020A7D1D6|nr:hypothetical protein [Pyxidicoccus xibeiensis]MCP3143909.1 hypothetical protein [Pyxidicoccus xibeiensis]
MKKTIPLLLLALPLSSCVRSPRPVVREEDLTIVFPHFFGQDAVAVGSHDGGTFELDGATLRALSLAANDFLPPDATPPSCWDKQESQRYRVIRQAAVIFIRIDEDPAACGRTARALHSGARYAISVDGRILRRIVDGQPEGPFLPVSPDEEEEDGGVSAEPGVPPAQGDALPSMTAASPDAGPTSPAPSSQFDGGAPPRPGP